MESSFFLTESMRELKLASIISADEYVREIPKCFNDFGSQIYLHCVCTFTSIQIGRADDLVT